MEEKIPEKWWERNEEETNETTCVIARRTIDGIVAELRWKHAVDTESEVIELLKTLEPKFKMSAHELLDELIATAKNTACLEIFEKHYGHLCSKNESGEILIPLSSIPEAYGRTPEEVESAVGQLLQEHPEWVCFKDEEAPNDLIH